MDKTSTFKETEISFSFQELLNKALKLLEKLMYGVDVKLFKSIEQLDESLCRKYYKMTLKNRLKHKKRQTVGD